MKNKKQNSIDWFINHLIKCGHNLSAHKLEIQQAKQMHKEEIKDAISVGYNMATPSEPYDNLHKGDKYYIEAYGGDDE